MPSPIQGSPNRSPAIINKPAQEAVQQTIQKQSAAIPPVSQDQLIAASQGAAGQLNEFIGAPAEHAQSGAPAGQSENAAGTPLKVTSHAGEVNSLERLADAFLADVKANAANGQLNAVAQTLFDDYAAQLVGLAVGAPADAVASARAALSDALQQVGQVSPERPGSGWTESVKDAFGALKLEEPDTIDPLEIDIRDAAVRSGLPAELGAAFDYYYEKVEQQDWGSVRTLAMEVDGQTAYAVTVTTDGDDQYLELFAADGTPLASGMKYPDEAPAWDATFGGIRSKVVYE